MALNVVKYANQLHGLPERYRSYAEVETRKRKGLDRLFGSRTGSVSLVSNGEEDRLRIRVVPPVWQKGLEDEWDALRRCYEQVLQLAAEHGCEAVSLPLLTAEEPEFPAGIDFKVAVDTANAFVKDHTLDIHLLAWNPDAFRMPQLRQDVERFLSSQPPEKGDRWAFPDSGRFTAMAPCPPSPAKYEQAARSMKRGISLPSLDFGSSQARPKKAELEAILRGTDAGFSETLLRMIDSSGKKDSEVYNRANVSRQHFSKIRNNPDYKPSKPTAIAFAIALELNLDQTRDLIGRAGYVLTDSIKFDKIITYFIQRRIYNMFDINEMLYEFDQPLLGA